MQARDSARCLNVEMSDHLLPAGSTAVVRGVSNGRVWYEQARRVLSTRGPSVTTARWPGSAIRMMPFYVESLRTGNGVLREQARQARAQGDWLLADSAWQMTGVVEQVASGRWFSVSRMFGADGVMLCWYVNFERPPAWRGDGWDTCDLELDLMVEPDGSWRWKDEDEYEHGRRLGLITDPEHKAVQQARDEAVAMIEAHSGVFAESTEERWLPDPTWVPPSLT
jgi:predicted RNA-binding protein associated with RNAse of E/G family